MPTDDRLQSLLKMLESEPDDAFCLYGVAQEYAGRDDHAQAESFYLKAIAADPTHAYSRFHLARTLEAMDRDEEAIAVLREGRTVAQQTGDGHAASEIEGFLLELGVDP